MLERLLDNFWIYLIKNHPEIILLTHDIKNNSIESIDNSFICNVNEIDSCSSSVFNSDFDLRVECARNSLHDVSNSGICTKPSDAKDICNIFKQCILAASDSDEMPKRGTSYNNKVINSEELSERGRHLQVESSDRVVELESVIQSCETKWHSFFKEAEAMKESSFENSTLNQCKDRMVDSVETTCMKRQEETENREIQPNESYSRVIDACKTHWHSFLKENKNVKGTLFKNFPFNQAKDRISNSLQTTSLILQEKSENQKVHQDESYSSKKNEQREVHETSAPKKNLFSVNCASSNKFTCTINAVKLSSSYSSHSDTVNCEQIKVIERKTDMGKSNSANSSVNNFTVSESLHSSSLYTVEVAPSNSSHFHSGNKSSRSQIPEGFLEHSLKLSGGSDGKLRDPRLNPNRKRKNNNDPHEVVLKRVKWANDPVVLSNFQSSNKECSDPKNCIVHPKGSTINSKLSDPRLKHSKMFAKHCVPSFHKTNFFSLKDGVSNSPTRSPSSHNHQHISSVVPSNRNIISNFSPNISPSTYSLERRTLSSTPPLDKCDISSSTFPLEKRDVSPSTFLLESPDISSSISPLQRHDISSSTSPSQRPDISSSTSRLERPDISSSTSPLEKPAISSSTSPSKKLKTKLSPDSMDDRSWTLPLKKRKLFCDARSSTECDENSLNKINMVDNYSNCEPFSKPQEGVISAIEVSGREHTVRKSLDEITAFIRSIRNQTNKKESLSSCIVSKKERRNQNGESSSWRDQTPDQVTINTSKKDLDCSRDDVMKPTENSLLCRRRNSNVNEKHSGSNDVVSSNGYSYPVISPSVNANTSSHLTSINAHSQKDSFPSEISFDVKRPGLHSESPHVSQNKSIEIGMVKIWRQKYLKSKARRQPNKLVAGDNTFCDKTSSRTEHSEPNNHDSSDISNDQSSEIQTMNSLVPLSNYFNKAGILKIVHVCSQVEIGQHIVISVKLPLKLVSKLCWKYNLSFMLIHLKRLISKEILTSSPSIINILRLFLKYPFTKHLIRHSNNGLNGDLKYLFLQACKEYCSACLAIVHEDIGTSTEQNDESLSVNHCNWQSSIKPVNLVADGNAVVNIPSESNSTGYVCLNSPSILTEECPSDDSTSFHDSGMEEKSINNTPLEDIKIQIQQNYETVRENSRDVSSCTAPLNSVVTCSALENIPSEANNTANAGLNSHTSLEENFSSNDLTLCHYSAMSVEREETETNNVNVEDIEISSLQNDKIASETISVVKSCIAPINSITDYNVLQSISSELKSTVSVCFNSLTYLPDTFSSEDSALCYDSGMLDETEKNDTPVKDIKITTLQNNKMESETTSNVKSCIAPINSVSDCHTALTEVISSDDSKLYYDSEMLDDTEEIESSEDTMHEEEIKIAAQENDQMGINENTASVMSEISLINSEKFKHAVSSTLTGESSADSSQLCHDSEMADETEEIESYTNTMHSEEIKDATRQNDEKTVNSTAVMSATSPTRSEKFQHTAHSELPGASFTDDSSLSNDSEMLDETEEIEGNKNTTHNEEIKISTQQGSEMTISENTTSVMSAILPIQHTAHSIIPGSSWADNSLLSNHSELVDETEEIVSNKNTMHDADIEIATPKNDDVTVSENTTAEMPAIKSEKFQHTSHSVLPRASSDDLGLCYDSEKFDKTVKILESSNISSTFWSTVNSRWEDFFQLTELGAFFGSTYNWKSLVKILGEKRITVPILEKFMFLNYENKFISDEKRNYQVNFNETTIFKNFDRKQLCNLCLKYFSTKITDIMFPLPAQINGYEKFYFVHAIEDNFLSLNPFQVQCFKQNKKAGAYNTDPEPNKKSIPFKFDSINNKPIPFKVDSKQDQPIAFKILLQQNEKPTPNKVDPEENKQIPSKICLQQNEKPTPNKVYSEKNKQISSKICLLPNEKPTPNKVDSEENKQIPSKICLQQNEKLNHRKAHADSLKDSNEVSNMIATSYDETENNSGILGSSCTDAKYQRHIGQVPLFHERLTSKNCSEIEISRHKQPPSVFNSDCRLRNVKKCTSAEIDALFQDFDLFKENGVLDRYYKHVKGFGNHTVNFDLIEKSENDLDGEMLESYRVLKEELNNHRDILRGKIFQATSPENRQNNTRFIRDIVVQLEYIEGYEIACKALLL